jgi:hypothetical protein
MRSAVSRFGVLALVSALLFAGAALAQGIGPVDDGLKELINYGVLGIVAVIEGVVIRNLWVENKRLTDRLVAHLVAATGSLGDVGRAVKAIEEQNK